MIGLSTPVYDTLGALYLYRSQVDEATVAGLYARERRVSKTRTLDGGVSVVDNGYAAGDRSLALGITLPNADQLAIALRLATKYSTLVLTTPDGAYRVCPASVQSDGSKLTVNLSFIQEA